MTELKLGLGLELYRGAELRVPVERVQLCERLGYHVVWTAEAYGSDAMTPLAYLAGLTDRIKLGTAIVQLAARTPAATAMQAMTIDAMAGGDRMIVGLGVSGPQIVEGWYGRPWGKPNAMLRDYVEIMRKVFRREEPLSHEGSQISLPYTGPGSIGQGKALKSIMHGNPNIEIWIASGGPRNTALCAEVADGWLPMGYGPDGAEVFDEHLDKGFAKRDARLVAREDFEVFANLTVEVTDDVSAAIAERKPLRAMYVGGMGSESHNYHRDAMARAGFGEQADRIQELFLAGHKQAAIDAMPDEYIEQGALFGSVRRIRERFDQAIPAGATGLTIRTSQPEAFELMADLAGTRDTNPKS
ncbi:MAG: LLM class F420-dependent oxidoreductase [Acidimicrobiales bacterium]